MGILIALPQSELYTFPRHHHLTLPSLDQDMQKPETEEAGSNRVATQPSSESGSLETVAGSTPPDLAHQEQSSDTDQQILDQEALRHHMLTHSLKGHKMSVTRTPFVGEITTVPSPVNPEVTFGIKRVGNREVMAHRDKNSAIRYIQTEGSDTFTTEKDYPVGSLRVDTVALVLENWNLVDDKGTTIRIDKDTVLSYLDPEELDFLYEKAMEINPILDGNGTARKNDSSGS